MVECLFSTDPLPVDGGAELALGQVTRVADDGARTEVGPTAQRGARERAEQPHAGQVARRAGRRARAYTRSPQSST